ncbi:MAG: hypothetical protein ACR2NZ_08545 [Rubripirellula sp.]
MSVIAAFRFAWMRLRPELASQRRVASFMFAAIVGLATTVASPKVHAETPARAVSAKKVPSVDMSHKPVPRLPSGIIIGDQQQSGYSDLVTLVLPRLSSGYVNSLPEYAKRYASMFKFTALADVKPVTTNGRTDYLLDRFGVGFSMDINGKLVVVTPSTANKLGANLGMIDRGVLSGNEDCLNDLVQVARTSRMIIFDAKANMLIGDKHEERYLRYFIWASPASGKLGILVWQLKDNGKDRYTIDCANMQLLPAGYREDRQINVSKGGLLSSIPTPDRFAMVQIPPGTPVPFSSKMREVAALKNLTPDNLREMMSGAGESLAQVSQRSNSQTTATQQR